MSIMSEPFVFLGNLPKPTPEERAEAERLIEKAKAEGHPWAKMAGMFRDGPVFDEWVKIMRENRRKADEAPDDWLSGQQPS